MRNQQKQRQQRQRRASRPKAARKPPRLNSGARVMKQLKKQGLTVRRLITHPDGSVEYELDTGQDASRSVQTKGASEWD